jgi:hypothetical protein
MNCVRCNKSPKLDTSNLFTSFIVLEDNDSDDHDFAQQATKTHEFMYRCIENQEPPNATLCMKCVESLESKVNNELVSLSRQVSVLLKQCLSLKC